jgi:hypothetical protein
VTTTRRVCPLVLLVGLVGACGGDGGTSPSELTISAHAGRNQNGPASAPLPQALAALVRNASGDPVAGQTVSWTTTDGSVDPASSTTDESGVAATAWRLGSTTGVQEVRASLASGDGPPVSFTATAGAPVPAPPLVATFEVPLNYGAHDTYVRDGVAFLCAWNTGLIILDVGGGGHGGSPASPVELGRVVTSDNGVAGGAQVHNAWWFHNPVSGENRYVFVGQEGPGAAGTSAQGDIHVVDASDLTTPQEVAFFHLGPVAGASTGTHNFWMDEPAQILYAAYYNGGVIALDVSGTLSGDLSSRLIANLQPGGAGATYVWGVQLYHGDLYASDMLTGLWQLRLNRSAGSFTVVSGGNNVPERFGADLWLAGGYAYTGTWGSVPRGVNSGNQVKVWRLSSSGAPTLANAVSIAGAGTVGDNEVSADGKYLLAVTERGRDEAKGLYVYRLADPASPALVAFVRVPGVGNQGGGLHTGTFADIGGAATFLPPAIRAHRARRRRRW